MRKVRLIARLDIKGFNLIKGVHLEGLRVIGSPNEYAKNYYRQGIDELIYMDCVASLYGRNHLGDIIRKSVENIFVPLTVGGGIRSLQDATDILRCGADKIAINTAAIARPMLITEIADRFGSQCVVLSVEAKRVGINRWEAYTDNGREKTGLDVLSWIKKGVSLGAGEILLTSIDQEGTRKGFDVDLIRSVTQEVEIPVISSGGMGSPEDIIRVVHEGMTDAVAMADLLHYHRSCVQDVRMVAAKNNIMVRHFEIS